LTVQCKAHIESGHNQLIAWINLDRLDFIGWLNLNKSCE
jgi:hypothetical protein